MIKDTLNLGSLVNRQHSLNRGLLAWWLALPNWNRGYEWRDICGRYHGAFTNMDASSDWLTTYRTGGLGAVDFDGTNDRVSTTLGFSTPFSATAWIYPRTFGGSSKGRVFDAGQVIWFLDNSGDAGAINTILLVANAVNTGSITTSNVITTNTWQHVGVSYDPVAGIAQHYVNGVNIGSNTATPGTAATNLQIGGRTSDNARNFDGMIDDVRVFDYLMTAEVFQQIYADSLAGYPRTLNRIFIPIGKGAAGGGGFQAAWARNCNVVFDGVAA
jgi:hypothetical protein